MHEFSSLPDRSIYNRINAIPTKIQTEIREINRPRDSIFDFLISDVLNPSWGYSPCLGGLSYWPVTLKRLPAQASPHLLAGETDLFRQVTVISYNAQHTPLHWIRIGSSIVRWLLVALVIRDPSPVVRTCPQTCICVRRHPNRG